MIVGFYGSRNVCDGVPALSPVQCVCLSVLLPCVEESLSPRLALPLHCRSMSSCQKPTDFIHKVIELLATRPPTWNPDSFYFLCSPDRRGSFWVPFVLISFLTLSVWKLGMLRGSLNSLAKKNKINTDFNLPLKEDFQLCTVDPCSSFLYNQVHLRHGGIIIIIIAIFCHIILWSRQFLFPWWEITRAVCSPGNVH